MNKLMRDFILFNLHEYTIKTLIDNFNRYSFYKNHYVLLINRNYQSSNYKTLFYNTLQCSESDKHIPLRQIHLALESKAIMLKKNISTLKNNPSIRKHN